MATAIVTFEEYLATTYHPDREWLGGELRERNVGKWEHARLQVLLAVWLGQNEEQWGILAATEVRILVAADRVRIADLAMVSKAKQPPMLTEPPVLVIEILSPDDSYSDTQERAHDYRAMGVGAVGIIDPKTRTGRMCYSDPSFSDDVWLLATVLKVPGTPIYVDLVELFRKLDQV